MTVRDHIDRTLSQIETELEHPTPRLAEIRAYVSHLAHWVRRLPQTEACEGPLPRLVPGTACGCPAEPSNGERATGR